jgi:hypothetical protein
MPEYSPAHANLPEQLETIERLRDAVEQTGALYNSAKEQVERARHAYRATELRDSLRANYRQALVEYTGFILKGVVLLNPANRI